MILVTVTPVQALPQLLALSEEAVTLVTAVSPVPSDVGEFHDCHPLSVHERLACNCVSHNSASY
jgi:hypothetical protein